MKAGLSPRKPKRLNVQSVGCLDGIKKSLTANGKLGTSSYELQIGATCRNLVFRHDLNEVSNGSTFNVEAMVSFEGLGQG